MTDNKAVFRPPKTHRDEKEHRRQLAEAIWNIQDGKLYSTGEVTLNASSATTIVDDRRVGNESIILFMPLTANAVTELYGATMYITESDFAPRDHQFTINHANNSQTDRDFRYLIIG